jgi:hypothetical protein
MYTVLNPPQTRLSVHQRIKKFYCIAALISLRIIQAVMNDVEQECATQRRVEMLTLAHGTHFYKLEVENVDSSLHLADLSYVS